MLFERLPETASLLFPPPPSQWDGGGQLSSWYKSVVLHWFTPAEHLASRHFRLYIKETATWCAAYKSLLWANAVVLTCTLLGQVTLWCPVLSPVAVMFLLLSLVGGRQKWPGLCLARPCPLLSTEGQAFILHSLFGSACIHSLCHYAAFLMNEWQEDDPQGSALLSCRPRLCCHTNIFPTFALLLWVFCCFVCFSRKSNLPTGRHRRRGGSTLGEQISLPTLRGNGQPGWCHRRPWGQEITPICG